MLETTCQAGPCFDPPAVTGKRYVELAQLAYGQGDRAIAEWLIDLAFLVFGGGETEETAGQAACPGPR